MDRDDAGMSDRSDEAQAGDTGMIGSESEEPGPGRDTSLTETDPVAGGGDQPRTTVGMSEGDPMRTRLGSHIEGAGAIGYNVAAAEEGAATQQTPAEDRPAYESEQPAGEATASWAGPATGEPVAGQGSYDPDLATEPVGDQASYESPPELPPEPVIERGAYEGGAGYEGEPGGAGMAGYGEQPGQDVPATYTGEEAEVTGRPEYADRVDGGDQPLYQEEPQRMDRPGGGGSLFTDEEPERLDRPGPQEPGVQEGVFDQEADPARRPSEGG